MIRYCEAQLQFSILNWICTISIILSPIAFKFLIEVYQFGLKGCGLAYLIVSFIRILITGL